VVEVVVVVVVVGVVVVVTVVMVGAGTSFGFGGLAGFGLACFSGFALPCRACDGGTAGVAGVAGLGAGGFADRAGIAGVARSCDSESGFGFGFGADGGGDAEGSGALAAGGVDGVLPAVVPPLEDGGPGAGAPGVGAGVPGVGAGVPGVGEGVGATGVPSPVEGAEPAPRAGVATGPPFEMKVGVKPAKTDGEAGLGFVTTCGPAGETSAGTLRTCVLGTASSRVAEFSSTVKACSQSWAEATAPAATAPT
jgi:hypothetical protein